MARTKQVLLDALAALHITNTSGTETVAPLGGKETNAKLEELLAVAEGRIKPPVSADAVESAKPGIVKEYTQNGMRYQRIRKGDGSTVDVRI